MSEQLTESLPRIRCTPTMRQAIESIAAGSAVSSSISDHLRAAVQLYIDNNRPAPGQVPAGPSFLVNVVDSTETGKSHPDSGRRMASQT